MFFLMQIKKCLVFKMHLLKYVNLNMRKSSLLFNRDNRYSFFHLLWCITSCIKVFKREVCMVYIILISRFLFSFKLPKSTIYIEIIWFLRNINKKIYYSDSASLVSFGYEKTYISFGNVKMCSDVYSFWKNKGGFSHEHCGRWILNDQIMYRVRR